MLKVIFIQGSQAGEWLKDKKVDLNQTLHGVQFEGQYSGHGINV